MKKKYLLLGFLLFCIENSCFPQLRNFNLTVYIANADSLELPIEKLGENTKNLSDLSITKENDRTFFVKGKLEYPCAARIIINKRKASLYFYLDSGRQMITTHLDSLRYPITVVGSKINEKYIKSYLPAIADYKKADDDWTKDYRQFYAQYKGNIPFIIEDSMRLIEKANERLRDSLVSKYIASNPDSYLSFWIVYYLFYRYGYTKFYDISFSRLSNKIKYSIDGAIMKERMVSSRQTQTGAVFPKTFLIDSFSTSKLMQSYYNNYTLIDFWYSHCGPCIAQFEKLNEIYARYNKRGFEIIGITTDSKKFEKDWKEAIKKYRIAWIQLWDLDGIVAKKISVNAFPTNFLVDKWGRIIEKDIDLLKLDEYLNKYLK